MQIKALQKNIRQTPRKMRLVVNEVKDLSLETAFRQLAVIERRATLAIIKVLKQAVSNAVNNHRLSVKDLEIKSILVTEGPRFKRWNAVSRGRAHSVVKRTSHIEVILETKDRSITVEKQTKTKAKADGPKRSKAARSAKVSKRDKKQTQSDISKQTVGKVTEAGKAGKKSRVRQPITKAGQTRRSSAQMTTRKGTR